MVVLYLYVFMWPIIIATVVFAVFYWDVLFDNWLSRLIKRKNKMVLDKEAEPEVKHRSSASYVMLFETGQYGRYYVVSGKEANLFRIHLLPEGVEVKKDLFPEVCPHKDAVLVYGEIRRGSCFSLEGWLHEGPWVEDFEKFADEQEAKIRKKKAEEDARLKEQKKIQDDHDQQLLALYSSNWKPIN